MPAPIPTPAAGLVRLEESCSPELVAPTAPPTRTLSRLARLTARSRRSARYPRTSLARAISLSICANVASTCSDAAITSSEMC